MRLKVGEALLTEYTSNELLKVLGFNKYCKAQEYINNCDCYIKGFKIKQYEHNWWTFTQEEFFLMQDVISGTASVKVCRLVPDKNGIVYTIAKGDDQVKEKSLKKQFTLKIKEEYEANSMAESLMKSGYVVGVNTSTDEDQVVCWNIDIYEQV